MLYLFLYIVLADPWSSAQSYAKAPSARQGLRPQGCNDRTTIYQQHGDNNTNYFYFDPRTYYNGSKSLTNLQYYEWVTNNINCIGQWCVDGWKSNNDHQCYYVTNLIPSTNKIRDIEGCSVAIEGNFIMAYGLWRDQLSDQYYGERSTIFGKDKILSAYEAIYRSCFNLTFDIIPESLCVTVSYIAIVIVFAITFSLLIVATATYLYYKKYQVVEEPTYDMIY
jgi:hypothetical protein